MTLKVIQIPILIFAEVFEPLPFALSLSLSLSRASKILTLDISLKIPWSTKFNQC